MDILLDIFHTIDYDILVFISEHLRGGRSDIIWSVISSLGNFGALWLVLAAILLFFKKTRRVSISILIALLFSLIVGNVLLKNLLMRPRPFATHSDLIPLFAPGDEWSFPSAHTFTSFAAASSIFFHYKLAGFFAYIPAILIAFSRLYACVHYPSDIFSGIILGIIFGLIAAWISDRLYDQIRTLKMRKSK